MWQNIKIWGGLIILAFLAIGPFLSFIGRLSDSQLEDFVLNLVAEMISAVVSIFVIVVIVDHLIVRRDRERQMRDQQQRAVWEAGSRTPDVAIRAVKQLATKEQLATKDRLTGDSGQLKGANLHRANLQNEDLRNAKLQDANLYQANLQAVELQSANLKAATLSFANLKQTELEEANLQGATLVYASLQEANLTEANLQEADLSYAKLQGADLAEANLDEANLRGTTLPDGTPYTEGTDLGRFTNRKHSDFDETLEKIKSIRQEMGFED